MVDAIDLLQCPICGIFYKPEVIAMDQTDSHCIKAHVVGHLLTEDVVDPPLTGSLLDIEV